LLVALLLLLVRRVRHPGGIEMQGMVLAALPLIAAASFLNVVAVKAVWFYLAVYLVGAFWTMSNDQSTAGAASTPPLPSGTGK